MDANDEAALWQDNYETVAREYRRLLNFVIQLAKDSQGCYYCAADIDIGKHLGWYNDDCETNLDVAARYDIQFDERGRIK